MISTCVTVARSDQENMGTAGELGRDRKMPISLLEIALVVNKNVCSLLPSGPKHWEIVFAL